MPTIGFLGATSPEGYATFVSGFRLGLRETGFVETENVAVIYRWAEGQYDRCQHSPPISFPAVCR